MFSYVKNDLKAGLVVFLVALPLCLGIALAQNAPLFSGIIAGVIGGIVVASISGSKLSVSGPAAGLTSIVLSSVTELGSFEMFLTSVVLAGVFQVLLGVLKAGIIGYYFPSSVIKGMLSAIGLLLIYTQFPHLVGYDKDNEVDGANLVASGSSTDFDFLHLFDFISVGATIIGLFCLVFLVLWSSKFVQSKKYLRPIPGVLLVVVFGILIDYIFSLYAPQFEVKDIHLVRLPVFNSTSSVLAAFTHPDFTAFLNPNVYKIGFLVAVVASLETLLSLEAVDKLDPDNQISPTNRELIAQGTGNILSGFLGGLPITSVIVRSSVNVSAGGKTQLASIIHGLLFIMAIFLFPGVLQMIPKSALAAILIVTGYNLFNPHMIFNIFKQGYDQFLPFAITCVSIFFFGLLTGVSLGIFTSIIYILQQNYRDPFKMIRDEIDGKLNVFIKLSVNVTFINKGKFIEVFNNIPNNSVVYIDGGRAAFVDKDVLEIISSFKHSAAKKNITVHLESIKEVEVLSSH